jgi:hypothetical protein
MNELNEYGVLAQVVSAAGAIMAAAAAIALSWRGRARWEPWEEDVSKGPQKVGGLVAAVIIAILWAISAPEDEGFLIRLALWLLGGVVLFLVLYGYLVGVQTYEKEVVVDGNSNPPKVETKKVIGGLTLTPAAKSTIAEEKITIQQYFQGTAYDPDHVWTRPSRAVAKQLFVLGYIGLVATGTIVLAVAAILIAFRM